MSPFTHMREKDKQSYVADFSASFASSRLQTRGFRTVFKQSINIKILILTQKIKHEEGECS